MKLLIFIVMCGWLAAMRKLCFCKQSLPEPPYTFSKDWSYRLKGILALFILIHHVSTRYGGWWNKGEYPLSGWVMGQFGPWGELVVGLFFFISGYGLLKSYKNNGETYISNFLSKRFLKILIPYVLITIITQVVLVIAKDGYNPWQILMDTYPRGFGVLLWFPMALLLFYLAFYFSFKYIRGIPKAITAVTLFVIALSIYYYCIGRGDWWYKSNLCFPIGLWYANYENTITKVYAKHPKIWLTIFTAIVLGLVQLVRKSNEGYIILRFIIPILPLFIVYVSYFFKSGRNIVSDFFGKISYEMFLMQFVFLETLPHIHPALYCVVLVLCTIGGAYVMQIIDNKTYNFLQR